MKKSYLTAVLTLTCLLGLGISARAQDTKGVRVNVPFEFVAGGATLPAGTYTIGRLSVDASSGIAIRGYGNGALVLPIAVDETPSGQPKLSFEQIGGKHFLSEAETPGGVYSFVVPRAMVTLAQKKEHSIVSSSGGS
ncbi:MAG: hypothetical protein ABSF59_18250 [Candidatus Sulfotelmatobacter sp.]|jgi:hypothetical protein